LLYNTSDLSPSIKKIIADLDANGDGVLDKGTTESRQLEETSAFAILSNITPAEFGVFCRKNTALLRPVLDIQSKARLKVR
jgi:hypothetical protein